MFLFQNHQVKDAKCSDENVHHKIQMCVLLFQPFKRISDRFSFQYQHIYHRQAIVQTDRP